MKIRVADYLAKRIAEAGVRHVFMISGGGAMHLNDAIGKNKNIEYVCNHHERLVSLRQPPDWATKLTNIFENTTNHDKRDDFILFAHGTRLGSRESDNEQQYFVEKDEAERSVKRVQKITIESRKDSCLKRLK